MEQDLKLRLLEDKLKSGDVKREDIITIFLALQHQNFVLSNSITNLIKHWPHEEIILIHPSQGIPIKIQTQE